MKKYVYVDYENMNNLKDYPKIDGKYFFFIGAKQTSIPKSLVFASNESEVEWIEIEGSGKNALDFHIAYYLAKNDTEKDIMHYVLSKDKGFDPLISSINKNHNSKIVKRIISLNDLSSNATKNIENVNTKEQDLILGKYEKVLKNLKGIAKNKRPKSESKLKAHIQSFSKNENWADNDIQNIIDELYRKRNISKGGNNRISYSIWLGNKNV